ncbi:MAG TPA: amidohydrolase [Pseudonocardiaceae bacterium]|nr:amidohydrolase [Pseudonocardiaceae bacterium]
MTRTQLLLGGRIYAPAAPDATAMAVTDGVITWIGLDEPGRAIHPDAAIVDLDGHFVTPAFVDAHVHATASGLLLDGLDLRGAGTLAECLDLVADQVRAQPGRLIWGHGWDETNWPERRPPTRDELDAICGASPVYLSRIDVHSALVSSALVDLAPDAAGESGWSAQGPLTRDAHHAVRTAALAGLDPDQRRATQLGFLRHAASKGIAAVHECAGPNISSPADFAELLELVADDTVDVIGYWGELADAGLAKRVGATGLAGDLFVDGAFGSRTAALTAPYADDPDNLGATYLTADQVAAHLIACSEASIQAGFHAIGDAAVAAIVDGFAQAEKTLGLTALAARGHRIEHLEMVSAEQAEQLARWGVIASVQPLFDATWGGEHGMYAQRLGAKRAATLNPFATLASAGVTLAFGSDTPVTPVEPWETVRAAIAHQTEGFGISARAAFTAHTRGGWRAAGVNDGLAGTLAPGAPATYAIWRVGELVAPSADNRVQRWSTDPRSGVPPLPSLRPEDELPMCLQTVKRGTVIYQHGAFGP